MPLDKAIKVSNDSLKTPYVTVDTNVTQLGTSTSTPNRGATANQPTSANIGDQYFNTTTNELLVYCANGWVPAATAPNAPTNVTVTSAPTTYGGNPGAVISWKPATTGIPASSYVVTSSTGGFTQTVTTTTATFLGLSAGTSYTFTVTAKNDYGSNSATSLPITPFTVPQAPVIGTASFTGTNGSVSVSFTPGNTGGATTTYTVYSSPGNISASGSSSPIVVSGLTTSQAYNFSVVATNAAGSSTNSSLSNSIVPAFTSVSGGYVASDATYYYNVFTSGTSSFTVSNNPLTADVLVIAGGGTGGGGYQGGGGGAGGVLYTPSQTLFGSYTTTVGPGGQFPSTNPPTQCYPGQNSVFGSLIALGGGGGGGEYISGSYGTFSQTSGGSGAGGSWAGGGENGAAGTTGQGFAGGNGYAPGNPYNGGGGGGAGGVGGNATSSVSGAGGSGTNSYSSWISAISSLMNSIVPGWSSATSGGYIAGGGAGSTRGNYSAGNSGGAGGGGNSTGNYNGNGDGANGIANTGSGGGAGESAGGNQGRGGAGGSGIVVVRYTRAQVGG